MKKKTGRKKHWRAVLRPSGFAIDGDGGIGTGTSDGIFDGFYEAAAVLVTTGTPEVSKLEPLTASSTGSAICGNYTTCSQQTQP